MLRFKVLEQLLSTKRKPIANAADVDIAEVYASHVFDEETMRKYLPQSVFLQVREAVKKQQKIELSLADPVANAMKTWALGMGATHYTHWFQPLTGVTAEKHDAFFRLYEGRMMEEFRGEALVQQIPDASAFPTGGLRSTFEARGYSTWDVSSPAFILDNGLCKTLCIPTMFVSYNGESLDYKTPLLKSIHYLNTHAVSVCNMFDRFVEQVSATVGCEQEFYVVDEQLYFARPDLLHTQRTLCGQPSPKGQQFQDHYFGAIPERIFGFLVELEQACWRVGIPIHTRHNETGPSQFEVVPLYEEANVALDHVQLQTDLMERISKRHGLKVLSHEKPFAHINGSAKHTNWAMRTDTGKNLLAPADTPRKNVQFLTFVVNTLKAIKDHEALLAAAVASYGNEYRLGYEGAPPASVSVFVGNKLSKLMDDLEQRSDEWMHDEDMKQDLKMDIHANIPFVLLNNTDGNRTAPIAFTGDKFEFRQVGANHNPSWLITIINTIVGNQLAAFKKEVEQQIKTQNIKKDAAILRVLRQIIRDSKSIINNGDANEPTPSSPNATPEKLKVWLQPNVVQLFSQAQVLTQAELTARYDVRINNYWTQVEVEAHTLENLSIQHVIPASLQYLQRLAENVKSLQGIGLKEQHYVTQIRLIERLAKNINTLELKTTELAQVRSLLNTTEAASDKATLAHQQVKPLLEAVRKNIDTLEQQLDDNLWTLPKYAELLFIK